MWAKKSLLTAAIAALTLAWSGCPGSAPQDEDPNLETEDPGRVSPMLSTYTSCDELHTDLRNSLRDEMRVRLLQMEDYYYWGVPEAGAVDDAGNAPSADAGQSGGGEGGATRTEGEDFSGTNNQEEGVDEADFVKTDGYFIYVLNGNRLEILGVPEFGQLTHESTLELEGYPRSMLVADDKLIIYSSIYAYSLPADHPLRPMVIGEDEQYGYWYRTGTLTKMTVVDISDKTAPAVTRQVFLEGNYQTARKVESSVRMVSYSWMEIPGLRYWPELPDEYYQYEYDDPQREEIFQQAVLQTIAYNDAIIASTPLDAFIPQIYEQLGETNFFTYGLTDSACNDFATATDSVSRGITSIFSMDLLGQTFNFDADHIVSNWSLAYASTDTLVIAEPAQDWWWYWNHEDIEEATNIHRFDISVVGETTYTGSGRVPGTIRNQFSLSEFEDRIRVASTVGQWNRWWMEDPAPPSSGVYVLEGEDNLDVVGSVEGIAEGEQIWSARFVADKAYVVTFRNIDPLWTIDLSEPTTPTIKGELEIPGVSTYIHPMTDTHLLTIGFGGDENGLDWKTQLNIFDVGDFDNPTRESTLSLAPVPDAEGNEWTWSWSEATYEHKAFQYWGPSALLAVPLSTYRYSEWEDTDTGEYFWGYEYRSKLEIVNAEAGQPLSVYGEVDHSDYFNSDPTYWWDYRDVRRSIFMGDYIYAISDRGVTATLLEDMSLAAEVELPGSQGYWY
jgi:hypothetical protein